MSHSITLQQGQIIKTTNYIFEKEISIELVFGDFGKNHRRLKVFNQKGLKCSNPACHHMGNRLILGIDRAGHKHWDIYTDNLVLMNIDHIISKSNGGSNHIDNLQPMCKPCNSEKGTHTVSNEDLNALILFKEEQRYKKSLIKKVKKKRRSDQVTLNLKT